MRQIAKNRVATEDSIPDTIQAFRDRLPGLKTYEHIYNSKGVLDQLMQNKIATAYRAFIHFCILATDYYRMSGMRK